MILIDFEYARIEEEAVEADDTIGSAIAEKPKARKKTKDLGQISGNRAAPQAGVKNIHPVDTKVSDDTIIALSVV